MAMTFDVTSSLARGVADRAAAWRFVRDFAAHWAEALESGDGWTDADLAAAEARLGVRLPTALREAYLLFGRREDLTSNHDVLLAPDRLYVDSAGQALVFRAENQGAASWGVLLADLPDDDPAVFIRADLADKGAERWEPWLERLSHSLLEIVLSESVQAEDARCDHLEPDDGDVELLEAHSARLPFPVYPLGEQEPGIRWFLNGDVLLRDDGMAVTARGRTVAELDRVRDLVQGDWLYDPR